MTQPQKSQVIKHSVFGTLLKTIFLTIAPQIAHDFFMLSYYQESRCLSLPAVYDVQLQRLQDSEMGFSYRQWILISLSFKFFTVLLMIISALANTYYSTMNGIMMYFVAYLTISNWVFFEAVWAVVGIQQLIEIQLKLQADSSELLAANAASFSNLQMCRFCDPTFTFILVEKVNVFVSVFLTTLSMVLCLRWRYYKVEEENENENPKAPSLDEESLRSKGYEVDTVSEYLKNEIQKYQNLGRAERESNYDDGADSVQSILKSPLSDGEDSEPKQMKPIQNQGPEGVKDSFNVLDQQTRQFTPASLQSPNNSFSGVDLRANIMGDLVEDSSDLSLSQSLNQRPIFQRYTSKEIRHEQGTGDSYLADSFEKVFANEYRQQGMTFGDASVNSQTSYRKKSPNNLKFRRGGGQLTPEEAPSPPPKLSHSNFKGFDRMIVKFDQS